MHVFLRSNADRLAIRPVETPWTEKRTIRVFGPSDLNFRENISYPIFWQESDLALSSPVAESEETSQPRASDAERDTHSASGPLQHVVSPSSEGQAKRPLTPLLRLEPLRQFTRNNSSHTLLSTSASAAASISSSTKFRNINDDFDLPLLPATIFVRNHDRSVSTASCVTVQIGLRTCHTKYALNLFEASPSSILGLPMAPRPACFADHDDWSDPASTRSSPPTETLKNINSSIAQTYKVEVVTPYEIFLKPLAFMPDPAWHRPRNSMPQQPRVPTELFALPQHAWTASRQTPAIRQPLFRNPRRQDATRNSNVHLDASHEQLQCPRPAFRFTLRRPQLPFPSQSVKRLCWTADPRSIEDGYVGFKPESAIPRPSGLPRSP